MTSSLCASRQAKKKSYKQNVLHKISKKKIKKKNRTKIQPLGKTTVRCVNLKQLDFKLNFHNLKKKCYKEKSKDLEIRQGFPLLP